MKFIAFFKSEWSGKETTSELIFPDGLPLEFNMRWAEREADKLEKQSYPPWKLIKVEKEK